MFRRESFYGLKNLTFKRVTQSILTRIILIGILFTVIGGVARYYLSNTFIHDGLVQVVSLHQEALAKEAAREIDNEINYRKQFITKLADNIPLTLFRQPKKVEQWLSQRHELNPLFSSGLLIIGTDGSLIGKTKKDIQSNSKKYVKYNFFKDALSGKTAVGIPIIKDNSSSLVLPIAAPVKDKLGNVIAVIIGLTALNSSGFLDVIRNGHIGESGDYLLIDPKEQIFILATKPELILKPTAKPGVNPLHDKALNGFMGSGITTNAQGVEEIAAFSPISSTGWFVVSRIPTKEALIMEKNMLDQLIKAHIIAIILMVILLFVILSYVLRPLSISAYQANKMANGELPLEPLQIQKMDEVGFLTAAFNSLLNKLLVAEQELKEIAYHDSLTKLPNRVFLLERLHRQLARCKRNHTRLALLFLDLDGFKPINDSLGHDAGDEALVEVAKRFLSVIRTTDTLARVGGDEFVIVLGDLDFDLSVANILASTVAKKCIDVLSSPMVLKGETKYLGVSIGIAVGDGESLTDELMSRADTAMYEAKKIGNSCIIAK